MKVQPTPTSPKHRASQQAEALERLYKDDAYPALERPAVKPRAALSWFVLSVVFGAVAGAVGALVLTVYGLDATIGAGEENANTPPSANITRRETDALDKELAGVHASLLALSPRAATKDGALPTYTASSQRGSAVLLTDDGWAVTTGNVLTDGTPFVAVTSDRKMLAVQSVLRDPATNLVFFRIDGAQYTPAALEDGDVPTSATTHVLAGNQRESMLTVAAAQIADRRFPLAAATTSSDHAQATYALDRRLPERFRGGPLVAEGRVAGILDGDEEAGVDRVWPVRAFRKVLTDVLRSGAVSRARLGLTYVDLGAVAGLPEKAAISARAGAYIVANGVAAGSPAAEAGLKAGDVITAMGEMRLSEQASVSDAILNAAPGDEIAITYLRKNVEYRVTATLDQLATPEE